MTVFAFMLSSTVILAGHKNLNYGTKVEDTRVTLQTEYEVRQILMKESQGYRKVDNGYKVYDAIICEDGFVSYKKKCQKLTDDISANAFIQGESEETLLLKKQIQELLDLISLLQTKPHIIEQL